MPEVLIDVNTTDDIGLDNRDQLVEDLSASIKIGEIRETHFRGADGLPSYIQLIGNWQAWVPIVAAATVFLKKIAERAADDAYPILKTGAQDVFHLFVEALSRARGRADDIPQIIVALDVPDDYFGTSLSISTSTEIDAAVLLANFVAQSQKIHRAVQAEVDNGARPVGGFKLAALEDGRFEVTWTEHTLEMRSRVID